MLFLKPEPKLWQTNGSEVWKRKNIQIVLVKWRTLWTCVRQSTTQHYVAKYYLSVCPLFDEHFLESKYSTIASVSCRTCLPADRAPSKLVCKRHTTFNGKCSKLSWNEWQGDRQEERLWSTSGIPSIRRNKEISLKLAKVWEASLQQTACWDDNAAVWQ